MESRAEILAIFCYIFGKFKTAKVVLGQNIVLSLKTVRNHVKLMHVVNSRRGFSKGTVLWGGCWLWAWQISWGLQTCIAERSKVPNG